MRQTLNYLTWGFLIVFALPTVMVLATWNSLPGEPLYNIKLAMEQGLFVLVSPSYTTQGNLSIKYTERRFSENKRLLADKGSVEGLQYLDKQVVATKDVIVGGGDAKTQAELAQTYIDTLTDLSNELSQQQQAIASAPSGGGGFRPAQVPRTTPPTPTPVRLKPTPTPFVNVPPQTQPPAAQQTPTNTPQPQAPAPIVQPPAEATPQQAQAIEQINDSQETIKETIKELEKVTKKAEQEERREEHQSPGQEQQTPDRGRSDRRE